MSERPSFFEGVGLALIAALAGEVSFWAMRLLLPTGEALRLLVAGLGAGYALYLLRRGGERAGRLVMAVFVLLTAGVMVAYPPPLPLFALVFLGLIWSVRALYFHARLSALLADLALNGLALAASVWALQRTGAVFPAVWCFFLVQALFVAVPGSARPAPGDAGGEDRFRRAHRAAEAALRKLSSTH
jgi:hypothetical protein